MNYEVCKYRGVWSIYCRKSETYMIYSGKNRKTKAQLEKLAEALNDMSKEDRG